MNILELKKHWIDGEPCLQTRGNSARIKAAHRLPSSGYEMRISIWLIAVFLAAVTLITHYAPERAAEPDENFLLAQAAFVVMALSNAFDALAAVARADVTDVPLENLRGWLFALYWIGGAILVLELGLFDLFTWLVNREHVTIIIDEDDDEVSVRHSVFRSKSVARSAVEDVLILPNHRRGHDVMIQHEGGLLRVASVYGDLTRPTLIKRSIERALYARGSIQSEADWRGLRRRETG
ncbi:hypothetical protein M8745_06365 [Lutimaribacter sp. EGI FJ00014]|uniref:Uncharacterized protein n=1 Tax=Lutimaribacter degradans TaxID=2945989 RepID=A0ACC5ZTT0_9RHOB|nr:hypothetical protein [Lutimaribacter sp. EGI FJ00013]MCM2561754.1 hypothetical protein [Lutimaribacter sp. EGI FJ00013]MCO0635586.1 hypothetical protein [Lutimaribacter sp. EGI FJ00014]